MWGCRKVGVGVLDGADPLVRESEVFEGWNSGIAFFGRGTRGRVVGCDVWGHEGPNIQVGGGFRGVVNGDLC